MKTIHSTDSVPSPAAVDSGLRSITTEIAGLEALAAALKSDLGTRFSAAVTMIRASTGRVIISGMGKSGHIGRKIAATLTSTGTPAYFVHPGEASHGDLGIIQADDVIIAISWSGETAELADLVAYAKRFRVRLIAFTSKPDSALGREADICLALPNAREACPNGLAPTTSTTMQLALGDALAVALLESRSFTPNDFGRYHPGGKLGVKLKQVRAVMHSGDRLPLIYPQTPMSEAILTMSSKGLGCAIVIDAHDRLCGLVTDGDLRRHMSDALLNRNAEEIMTKEPKTIAPDALVAEALEMVDSRKLNSLIVVEEGKPVGVLHVLDLLRIGAA
ncbi:MAG: SIS domain-containing protein [Hyphomicrobiales bacterium]